MVVTAASVHVLMDITSVAVMATTAKIQAHLQVVSCRKFYRFISPIMIFKEQLLHS